MKIWMSTVWFVRILISYGMLNDHGQLQITCQIGDEGTGIPSRHNTLNQCWFNVGPPSTTLDQRETNIDSTSCVFWDRNIVRRWLNAGPASHVVACTEDPYFLSPNLIRESFQGELCLSAANHHSDVFHNHSEVWWKTRPGRGGGVLLGGPATPGLAPQVPTAPVLPCLALPPMYLPSHPHPLERNVNSQIFTSNKLSYSWQIM